MMETILHRNGLEHDTTVCGDPKTWFPMRVTYQREMKVKADLDQLGDAFLWFKRKEE